MNQKFRILQKTFIIVILVLSFFLLQSELILKILLLLSVLLLAFLMYPYASLRMTTLRQKLFGHLFRYQNRSLDMTGRKLDTMADSLRTLSESFLYSLETEPGKPDKNQLMEEISDKLCRVCDTCENCWGDSAEDSYRSVCELLELACSKGSVQISELPEYMKNQCSKAEQYVGEINDIFYERKQRELGRKRLLESREMIAEQIQGVASAVHSCAKMLCGREEVTELQKQVISSYLYTEGIRVRELAMFHDSTSGRELVLCAKCHKGSCITVKVLAERLGALLEIPLISSEENRNVIHQDYQEFVFYEMPRFHVLTGVARLVREGETHSGDNYSFVRTGKKNSIMVLADGMGSGLMAGKDSTMVVELLEQLLEAGFEETAAVRMLNTVLVLRSEQVQFTTLDLCILNMYTGNCEFVKAGAATTFIKRKNWVEAITSTSIPLGFLGLLECEIKHKKLYHDDYIIMVSDGALDCIGVSDREEYLENLIADLRDRVPRRWQTVFCVKSYKVQGIMPGMISRFW